MLDKTGTVTTGRMTLLDVVPAAGEDAAEVLRLAGALEAASEHPIARAVARAAAERCGACPPVADFANSEGLGVTGVVDGRGVVAGRRRLLAERGAALPEELERAASTAEASGRTVVAVGWDGAARGVLVVADAVKPTSADAVRQLRDLGLTPILLTGDNETVARGGRGRGRHRPRSSPRCCRRRRSTSSAGSRPRAGPWRWSATASTTPPRSPRPISGLAMGTGTDVAIEASDLTLVRGDLRAAADAIRLSRRTLATIKGNLFWAFAYNVAAIPLAAAGLLNPMIAGAAMAFSSVFVVTNSLRLRGFAPLPENRDATPAVPGGRPLVDRTPADSTR